MIIWKKKNRNGETVITTLTFKGKNQMPLIMIINETHHITDEVVWAEVVYELIKKRISQARQ